MNVVEINLEFLLVLYTEVIIMVVQHNLRAMNSNRMLGITQGTLSKSAEKLSSGYKINRSADDAAGLAISEKMRKQIRGLSQASLNAEDGISSVQTAEGALTEVHDMLQRMNELATKAANGTNSVSDRATIQDEVSQLLTEIDRVAETTKFNEMYLLKGDKDTKTVSVKAHDAGLEGRLTQNDTQATFVMNALKLGDTIKIGGTEYTIGSTQKNVQDSISGAIVGETITIDGETYEVAKTTNADKRQYTVSALKLMISKSSEVIYKGKKHIVIYDRKNDVSLTADTMTTSDTNRPLVISKATAYGKISEQLQVASSVGATTNAEMGTVPKEPLAGKTTVTFSIKSLAMVERKEGMTFSLHVGADADMTNKISVQIDALDTAGLGIKGLNVKDYTGAAATYAIDAIGDAITKISAQRSLLGAVQNRLEHTINNLDNVVENTTSAESTIRDTDMATEMVKYSNSNILSQAGQSMLAQSNQANQGVLSLLG